MSYYAQMIAAFIVILGGMVVIHEFGHFIVAKLFGIRVLVFSVGLGKRIWGVKRGDTDYRLSLIPMGGYVKMAGETLDEEISGAPDEFMSKPKWQRFCVAIAGPAMNVLTALAIPAVLAMIHYEMPAYLSKPALVGVVDAGLPADKAGIRPGDLITKIDGTENPNWNQVLDRIELNPDQVLPVTIRRGSQIQNLELKPVASEKRGQTEGEAGLRWVSSPNAKVFVSELLGGEPAERAGLKPGDQLLAYDNTPVEQDEAGSLAMTNYIHGSGGKPVTLKVRRDGQTIEITASPKLEKDGLYYLGFRAQANDGETVVTRLALVPALRYSYKTNLEVLWITKEALGQVLKRQRKASETFAGPIQILKFSGEAAQQGIGTVFQLMALLSLNLGIFNLLPIPILDGGLIFMILLEGALGLLGLPLTRTVKERMIQVGFVFIVVFMAYVIVNDLRHVIPSRAEPQQQTQQAPAPNR